MVRVYGGCVDVVGGPLVGTDVVLVGANVVVVGGGVDVVVVGAGVVVVGAGVVVVVVGPPHGGTPRDFALITLASNVPPAPPTASTRSALYSVWPFGSSAW